MYRVIFSPDAQKDVITLKKKAPLAFKKLMKIYEELEQHPRSGTGQCEQLKHFAEETWSRRLDKEHRVRIVVFIIFAYKCHTIFQIKPVYEWCAEIDS